MIRREAGNDEDEKGRMERKKNDVVDMSNKVYKRENGWNDRIECKYIYYTYCMCNKPVSLCTGRQEILFIKP